MLTNIRRSFLLIIGLSFCLFGCDPQRGSFLVPDNILSEDGQSPAMEGSEIANAKTTFQQNLLPILTEKCAYVGCHVAGGPKNLDFSTYQAFINGGDGGPVFTLGNAQGSSIIAEIVSGRMPPDGPPLTAAQIQLFRDWINQQDPADFPNLRYDDDDYEDDEDDDYEDDEDDDYEDDEDDDYEDDEDDDYEDDEDDDYEDDEDDDYEDDEDDD